VDGLVLKPHFFTPTFSQVDEPVSGSAREIFGISIRPTNLDAIERRDASHSKVEPQIVARYIAGSAPYLLHKSAITRKQSDLSADAVAIGFRSMCDHTQPVVVVGSFVHQEHRLSAHVVHGCGDPSVIPEIRSRKASA
jgi:hypothetical protein